MGGLVATLLHRWGWFLVLSDSSGFLQSLKILVDFPVSLVDACTTDFNKGTAMITRQKNFSQFIFNRRRELNLSQDKLAKQLGFKNGQYIHNIERMKCGFPVKLLARLSIILQTPLEKLKIILVDDYMENITEEINKSLGDA